MSVIIAGSLSEVLYQAGIVSEADVRNALEERARSGRRFGEALIDLGIVTAEDIAWALSRQLDIPFIRLNRDLVDRNAASFIPATLARRHQVVPIIKTDGELRIAMTDPLDQEALRSIGAVCRCPMSVSISELDDIRQILDYLYGPETDASFGFTPRSGDDTPERVAVDPSGGAFLDFLLNRMVSEGWSSATFHPSTAGADLTGSHEGTDRAIGSLTTAAYGQIVTLAGNRVRMAVHSGPARVGSLICACDNAAEAMFRVATLETTEGTLLTITRVPELASVEHGQVNLAPGLSEKVRALAVEAGVVCFAVRDDVDRHRLMAQFAADRLDRGGRIILVGEGMAPFLPGHPQIPLKGLSADDAASVLDHTLEHGPHLILIDTITGAPALLEAAGRAALKGVTVAAGISASLPEAVDLLGGSWSRLPALAYSLTGIVSLRHVATLCPFCREPDQRSADKARRLQLPLPPGGYFRSPGCARCAYTGVEGRLPLMDVVIVDADVAAVLGSAHGDRAVMTSLVEQGLVPAQGEGAGLLADGMISPEEYVSALCS